MAQYRLSSSLNHLSLCRNVRFSANHIFTDIFFRYRHPLVVYKRSSLGDSDGSDETGAMIEMLNGFTFIFTGVILMARVVAFDIRCSKMITVLIWDRMIKYCKYKKNRSV